MQYSLDILAQEIRVDMARRNNGEQEWRIGSVNLCVHIAQARTCFPDNIGFGKWDDEQGFKLSHQDRAAAIAMGQDPERLRDVMAKTERRSLRHIYEHEFRLTHAGKTQPKPRPVNPANDEKRDRAFAVYDRRMAAGEDMSMAAVAAEAGVSNTVIRAVFTTRQAEEAARAEIATEMSAYECFRGILDEILAHKATLTPAERKKWDKHVEMRGFHYHFEQQVADRNGAWLQKWKEESGAAYYEARLDKIEEQFTSWPYSVMRRSEYNVVLRCLHPDTAHSRSDEERAEAFRYVTQYKSKMVHDDEEARAARSLRSGMPKTVQEMMARKAARDAELRAARATKKAAKDSAA